MMAEHGVPRDEERVESLGRNALERVAEFRGLEHADLLQRDAQRRAGAHGRAEDSWMDRIRQVHEKGHPLHARARLLHQRNPLLDERAPAAVAGDVASGLRRARDDSEVDGVAAGHEHDRNLRGRPLGGEGHGSPDARDDERHPEADEFYDESGKPLEVSLRGAWLDAEAASLDPAALGQTFPKRIEIARWQDALRDEADGSQLPRRLPFGHAWSVRDGKRAADERAP